MTVFSYKNQIKERRIKAINEMNRILKVGGRALITVWAKEQKYKDKESIYISKKSSTNKKNPENEEKPDTNIHKFGKEFEKKIYSCHGASKRTINQNQRKKIIAKVLILIANNLIPILMKKIRCI